MKVLVGLSGGVDSAVCALRLSRQGYEVEGAVLRMHEYTEVASAKTVADSLGIPLHVIDCTQSFHNIIKENFICEYAHGRTPNPCILCNERVKFAELYDYAQEHGFDYIATGHYAKIVKCNGRLAFAVAEDARKDQSYMLYRLPQHVLARLLLPLAEISKSEVRSLAEEAGIPVADKPDSQEICFLPDGGYAEYIESRRGKFPKGSFIDPNGRVLGTHKGIIRYTVGQRKGLGIALGERTYVTAIDPDKNTVTLSSSFDGKSEVCLTDSVASGIEIPTKPQSYEAYAKLRYTAPLTPCVATLRPDGTATLRFDSPVKSAPGQSAVLYDEEGRVLFGGFIT